MSRHGHLSKGRDRMISIFLLRGWHTWTIQIWEACSMLQWATPMPLTRLSQLVIHRLLITIIDFLIQSRLPR